MPSDCCYLILPNYSSSRGGPGTFYRRFENHFQSFYNLRSSTIFKPNLEFLLIINGTRRLDILFLALLCRISIVTRLGSFYRSNIFTEKTIKARLVHCLRTLLISIAILCSSKIIFQSDTVRNEWCTSFLSFLFRKKKLFTIYNCVPDKFTGSFIFDDSRDEHINLISLEAKHCPLANSFPFYIFQELNKSGYKCNLHVFGHLDFNETHLCSSKNHNIYTYGFIPLDDVHRIVTNLTNPLFVVEDNFPCGCPNSMLEIQGMGIPSIALANTVASELIRKFKSGLIVPTTKANLKKAIFPTLNVKSFLSQLSKSYSLSSSNCLHLSTALSPSVIFAAYFDSIFDS